MPINCNLQNDLNDCIFIEDVNQHYNNIAIRNKGSML